MALISSHLEAFLAVSQTLSFTKAAESLHITQSALSQRIMNLEQELETTLFIRDRAGLKLTEVALKLVHYCKIKNNLENDFIGSLKSQNSHELTGLVRVGGFSSITASVIIPSLAPLAIAHPKVRIQTMTKEIGELSEMLARGEIDYMILDDRLEKDHLERVLLGKEINFLVQSRSGTAENIYLDHDEHDPTTLLFLKKYKYPTKSITQHYLDDIYGLIAGVKAGLGRAVLPQHLIKHEKSIEVIEQAQTLEIPVYLYFYARPYYSKIHASIVDALKKGFTKELG